MSSLFDDRGADLSPCGRYRWTLWRRWEEAKDRGLHVICLNPSTADAEQDDPTVTRLCRRARRLGYAGLVLTNLFAWRATDPRELRKVADPIGEHNDAAILANVASCYTTLCAWGSGGSYLGRAEQVRELLEGHFPGVHLHCLRVGKDGNPGHPLYLPYSAEMTRWNG